MDRNAFDGRLTDPVAASAGNRDVELYVRTYRTLLQSSGDIRIKTLVPAHVAIQSVLHPNAESPFPDMSALIYSTLRLPPSIVNIKRILLGVSREVFLKNGFPDVEQWRQESASARRRWWFYDGAETLAVYLGSSSDLDDLIPVLTAYQIEWNKLHFLLTQESSTLDILRAGMDSSSPLYGELTKLLQERTHISPEDWLRLEIAWGANFPTVLLRIAEAEKSFSVRMLGGTHVAYAKSTRTWWEQIERRLEEMNLRDRPCYLVSSNPHSIVNLLSGSVSRRRSLIDERVRERGDLELEFESERIRSGKSRGNWENYYYFAARKVLWDVSPDLVRERISEELDRGICSVESRAGLRVDAQIIELAKLIPEDFDPRLDVEDLQDVAKSDAVIINIDYPLGLAAYRILRQCAESLDRILGLYIIGKAATLNGSVGDVMLSDVVFDEHSQNHYWLDNAFQSEDIAPYLNFGSVLDRQKLVTVLGTFLQNTEYLDFYYREHFTVVEMEAGPYFDGLYELIYPSRYPTDEHINLSRPPLDVGIIHYASDTPFTRGKNLGANKTSYFGLDSAYATTVAVLRRLFSMEIRRIKESSRSH